MNADAVDSAQSDAFNRGDLAEIIGNLRATVEAETEALTKRVGNTVNSVRNSDVLANDNLSDTALKESKDFAAYFMTGFTKRLLAATPDFNAALAITAVLTDRNNMDVLNSLFLSAHLRGYQQAVVTVGLATTAPVDDGNVADPTELYSYTSLDAVQDSPQDGQ